jgi:hypothetical protein
MLSEILNSRFPNCEENFEKLISGKNLIHITRDTDDEYRSQVIFKYEAKYWLLDMVNVDIDDKIELTNEELFFDYFVHADAFL